MRVPHFPVRPAFDYLLSRLVRSRYSRPGRVWRCHLSSLVEARDAAVEMPNAARKPYCLEGFRALKRPQMRGSAFQPPEFSSGIPTAPSTSPRHSEKVGREVGTTLNMSSHSVFPPEGRRVDRRRLAVGMYARRIISMMSSQVSAACCSSRADRRLRQSLFPRWSAAASRYSTARVSISMMMAVAIQVPGSEHMSTGRPLGSRYMLTIPQRIGALRPRAAGGLLRRGHRVLPDAETCSDYRVRRCVTVVTMF